MRLLIYSLYYDSDSTGIARYTADLGAWLTAQGHTVRVIAAVPHYPAWRVTPANGGNAFYTSTEQGARVMRVPLFVPQSERVRGISRLLYESSFLLASTRPWLRFLLRREAVDRVICIVPSLLSTLFPHLLRLVHGTPWNVHVQDLQVDAAASLGILPPGRVLQFAAWMERASLSSATAISTISRAMQRRLYEKLEGSQHVWLVPNWADLDSIAPGPRMNSVRESLGLTERDTLVLYAGNLGEKQGLHVLVEAADALRRDHNIHFLVAGDGAAKSRLVSLIGEKGLSRVTILPVQPRARLPELLNAADIHAVVQRRAAADLVMPSKLTNILACGGAVVATAEPGSELHRIVSESGAGKLVPAENPDALAQAIKDLDRDPSLRAAYGTRARRYAESHLSKDAILEDFMGRLRASV